MTSPFAGEKMKCGCLTLRYKIALNALHAIKRHMEIVSGDSKIGLSMSSVYQICTKAIDSINEQLAG